MLKLLVMAEKNKNEINKKVCMYPEYFSGPDICGARLYDSRDMRGVEPEFSGMSLIETTIHRDYGFRDHYCIDHTEKRHQELVTIQR